MKCGLSGFILHQEDAPMCDVYMTIKDAHSIENYKCEWDNMNVRVGVVNL